jgi:GTP-binding protein Era
MMGFVNTALTDADVILYVTDVTERSAEKGDYTQKIISSGIDVIIAVNKIDLTNQGELETIVESWHNLFPQSPVIPVSAINKFNLNVLLNEILSKLPESPPYFPKDQLTDKYERFFASEIIREKILLNYKKEIPYSVEIEIESFKEEKDILRIRALIHVTRDTQNTGEQCLRKWVLKPGMIWKISSVKKYTLSCMSRLPGTGVINQLY